MILSKSHPATVLASRVIALYNEFPTKERRQKHETNVRFQISTTDMQGIARGNEATHCLSTPMVHKMRFCAMVSGRSRLPKNGMLPDDVDLEYYIIETFVQKDKIKIPSRRS
jgi:hypothetical protein